VNSPSQDEKRSCRLLTDLKELLGREVDVVEDDAIYWLLRRRILKEARPV